MGDRKRCKADITDPRGWVFNRCRNRAVTEVGYCRLHDPDERRKRAKKRGPTQADIEFERSVERGQRLAALENRLRESTAMLEQLRHATLLWPVIQEQIEANKEVLK